MEPTPSPYPTPLLAWLVAMKLTTDHLDALCRMHRNFALYAQRHLAEVTGHEDYSYVAASISNDLEAELFLVASGFPAQALALLRGTWEKLAFWKKFVLGQVKHVEEYNLDRPSYGQRLLKSSLGGDFDVDTLKTLNKLTHADLKTMREFLLVREESSPSDEDVPLFVVGAHFGWHFNVAMRMVLVASATMALDHFELMRPPPERISNTFAAIVQILEAIHQKGACMSERTITQIARLGTIYQPQADGA